MHDLIAMKLRANRPQDDYDISEIIKKTPLDEALLMQRVTPEQFARFQAIKTRVGLEWRVCWTVEWAGNGEGVAGGRGSAVNTG